MGGKREKRETHSHMNGVKLFKISPLAVTRAIFSARRRDKRARGRTTHGGGVSGGAGGPRAGKGREKRRESSPSFAQPRCLLRFGLCTFSAIV